MELEIGRCGVACGVCKRFNEECLGCEEENRAKNTCIVFICAEKKNVSYCIQCPDNPCNLMRGLSKAYCPVISQIKFN